jgi:hypothetical protein
LIVFAANNASEKVTMIGFGNLLRSDFISPMPVTIPIRAHIICTAAISGQVSNAVHNMPVPSLAPAIEYVAIPEGSSSAAPVIRPGPSAAKKRLAGFFFATLISGYSRPLSVFPTVLKSIRPTPPPNRFAGLRRFWYSGMDGTSRSAQ